MKNEFIRGCVICGGHDKRETDIFVNENHKPIFRIDYGRLLMVVLCADGIVRQIHGGECNTKFMLTDLSNSTEEEHQIAEDYLAGKLSDD